MKLLHATVANYRVHELVKVDFHKSTSLLGGQNEAGKSTLIEAIHRAFFLPAKGETAIHKSMRREGIRERPSVDVHFEHEGRTYELHKHFGGNTGYRVELKDASGKLHEDDAAEDLLREITGDGFDKSPRKEDDARKPWSHLWVWQGSAGDTPTEFIEGSTDQLVALTSKGAGTVTMSRVDTAVAGKFQDLHKETYGDRGGSKAKKASQLGTAQVLQDDCTSQLEELQALVKKLEGAAEVHAQAQATITASNPRKHSVQAELNEIAEQVAAARTIEIILERARDKHRNVAAEVVRLRDEFKKLKAWDTAIKELQEKLSTDTKASTLATAAEQAVAAQQAAKAALAQARAESAPLAQRQAKAAARLDYLRATKALSDAQRNAERVADINKQLSATSTAIDELPNVKQSTLDWLRGMEQTVVRLQTELKAVQSTLVLSAASEEVLVNGTSTTAGTTVQLAAETRITTASGIELNITVPGASNAEEVERQLHAAQHKLEERITAHVVHGKVAQTVQQLADAFRDRESLTREQADLTKRLRAEKPEAVAKALTQAQHDEVRATSADNALETFDGWPDPQDVPAAELCLHEHTQAAANHKQTAQDAEQALDRCQKQTEEANERVAAYAKTKRKDEDDLKLNESLRKTLLAAYDDSLEAFTTALAKLEEQEAADQRQLALRQAEFDQTQLSVLLTRQSRNQERLTSLDNELAAASRQLHQAEGQLRPEAGEDPFTELRDAEEQLKLATLDCEQHTLDAKANALLDRLFQEEFDAANERITKPLADRVAAYLKILYGNETNVLLDYDGGAFGEFSLVRPSMADFPETFSSLSGGAREQVAAAVRLATAEILAADYGGQLPVVFDDAFVNTDPTRIPKVIDMLYHAADSGLQVIVSTCDPTRYENIGKVKWTVTRGAGATSPSSALV